VAVVQAVVVRDMLALKAVQVARAMAHPHHAVVVLHKGREAIVKIAAKELLTVRQQIDSTIVAAKDPMTEAWIGTWIVVVIMAHEAMSCHVTLTRS
jgi:hypothetical protein